MVNRTVSTHSVKSPMAQRAEPDDFKWFRVIVMMCLNIFCGTAIRAVGRLGNFFLTEGVSYSVHSKNPWGVFRFRESFFSMFPVINSTIKPTTLPKFRVFPSPDKVSGTFRSIRTIPIFFFPFSGLADIFYSVLVVLLSSAFFPVCFAFFVCKHIRLPFQVNLSMVGANVK